MNSILDPVRSFIPAEWREKLYTAIGGTAVVLGSMGFVDDNTAATVSQILLAGVGLLFAVLYSTSELRAALYTALLAVQSGFALWSIGNDATWAGVVSVAAAVLGLGVAAAKTPVAYDVVPAGVRFEDDFSRARGLGDDWSEDR